MRSVMMLLAGLGFLAVGGLAATGSGVVVASPAGADPLTDCTTTTGVIVAVDFAPWNGNIVRGCAVSSTTGYAAMLAAGFTPAGDQHDGAAFICRIDDDPPPSQDACIDTPPPTASWSYWHADAGQSTWTYSDAGAMDYCPPPGSVDAWVFVGTAGAGSTGYPPFLPSALRATAPGRAAADPCDAPGASSSGSATGGSPSSPVSGSSTPGTTQPTAPMAGAPTTTTNTFSSSSSRPPVTTVPSNSKAADTKPTAPVPNGTTPHVGTAPSASRPKVIDADPASVDHRPTSGSPVPLVIGGCLAALLAGGGGLVAWRRRREQLDQR